MRYDDLNILYEDNHLIAAVKPAGVLSQADSSGTPDMLTLLKQYIKVKYNKPGEVWLGLVHRLDQPVSGVMIFARTSKAAARLSEQIREHQTGKYYLAVVRGKNVPEQAVLDDLLVRDSSSGKTRTIESSINVGKNHKNLSDADENRFSSSDALNTKTSAKAAILEMCKLKTAIYHDVELNLLEIKLGTGRGHQIRVQLSSRGWPILGNGRYDSSDALNSNLPIRKTIDSSGKEHADLALFCSRMEIIHPVRKEPLSISAQPPDDFPWNVFK